jgi:hypothetical protein
VRENGRRRRVARIYPLDMIVDRHCRGADDETGGTSAKSGDTLDEETLVTCTPCWTVAFMPPTSIACKLDGKLMP